MWNTHSSLFCFTSRLFATYCYWPVTLPAGGRRRQDGAMRAIKDQHRQRASLVSTDGAKVGESFNAAKENGLGWKEVKEKVKVRPFFTPFWPFWWKLVKVWWKFGENLCENSPRGWWTFEENSLKFAKKTGCHPCASPPWTHKQPASATSIYRASYSLVIMSSCRYVIMPLRILLENAVYGFKEIVYII